MRYSDGKKTPLQMTQYLLKLILKYNISHKTIYTDIRLFVIGIILINRRIVLNNEHSILTRKKNFFDIYIN